MSGFNKEKDDEFDIEAAVSSLGEELFGASDEDDSDADTSDRGSADTSSVPSPDATDDGAGAAPAILILIHINHENRFRSVVIIVVKHHHII